MLYPTPIAKLIDSYSKLPGIGIKTATRLAFYTIGMSADDVNEFAKNLLSAKRELTYCSICGRLTDDDPCSICTDPTRDQTTILVLEDSRDVAANGKYPRIPWTLSCPAWPHFSYEWYQSGRYQSQEPYDSSYG